VTYSLEVKERGGRLVEVNLYENGLHIRDHARRGISTVTRH